MIGMIRLPNKKATVYIILSNEDIFIFVSSNFCSISKSIILQIYCWMYDADTAGKYEYKYP